MKNYQYLNNEMVVRPLDIKTVNSLGELLEDQQVLETLLDIKEKVVSEEEANDKRKKNTRHPDMTGWCLEESCCGSQATTKDEKAELEHNKKLNDVIKLVHANCVDEGAFIPIVEHVEKETGNKTRGTADPIKKFKVTDVGEAVIELATNIGLLTKKSPNSTSASNGSNNNKDVEKEEEKGVSWFTKPKFKS